MRKLWKALPRTRFHCWRPLSSPSLAPASYLRKLGSPWERVCPWGRPLGFVPCGLADLGADRRGAGRPPRAQVLAQAGGSASAEECGRGEEDARRNLVPGARVGRGGAAASNSTLSPAPGSCTFLACHLLCSLTEGSYISAQPRSKA
ncbi:unnamed protein product [Nyctereutes procyonoides]|uniref:(raccoon dog) hypothetical protein n=1 Tax=Nyctereutes procyonoides TaxID=34880 RepID=A0A811YDB0_NYCPR|nr:unnamed protein product [Nyctereutes procyonoides]